MNQIYEHQELKIKKIEEFECQKLKIEKKKH